jgi:hypothetical protein
MAVGARFAGKLLAPSFSSIDLREVFQSLLDWSTFSQRSQVSATPVEKLGLNWIDFPGTLGVSNDECVDKSTIDNQS